MDVVRPAKVAAGDPGHPLQAMSRLLADPSLRSAPFRMTSERRQSRMTWDR